MGAQHPTHQTRSAPTALTPACARHTQIKAENSNERSAFYNDSRSCIG